MKTKSSALEIDEPRLRIYALVLSPTLYLFLVMPTYFIWTNTQIFGWPESSRWLSLGLVTVAFYCVSLVVYRFVPIGQKISSRYKALSVAGMLTCAALLVIAGWIHQGLLYDVWPPLLLSLAACTGFSAGPSARSVGVTLLFLGISILVLHLFPTLEEAFFWLRTGKFATFWDGFLEDRDAIDYLLMLGCIPIIVIGAGIAIRRARLRWIGILACLIGMTACAYSFQIGIGIGGSGESMFVWDFRNYYDLRYGREAALVYEIGFLICLIYLSIASDDELVWNVPAYNSSSQEDAPQKKVSPATDVLHWHKSLLGSLASTSAQRDRSPNLRVIISLTVAIVFFGLASLIVPVLVRSGYLQAPISENYAHLVYVFWAIFWVCVVGRMLSYLRRYRARFWARSAEQELEEDNSRQPIFYLRSFRLDEWDRPTLKELVFGQTPSAEEKLVQVLRREGPVIAIGQPNEKLPRLGAARFYVTDDLWKQKVADVANVSQLVIWATGVSPGLRWELSYLLSAVSLDRLILWAHPHLIGENQLGREREWSRFLQLLGGSFPRALPLTLNNSRFFYFAEDGDPIPVGPGRSISERLLTLVRGAQGAALRKILDLKKRRPVARRETQTHVISPVVDTAAVAGPGIQTTQAAKELFNKRIPVELKAADRFTSILAWLLITQSIILTLCSTYWIPSATGTISEFYLGEWDAPPWYIPPSIAAVSILFSVGIILEVPRVKALEAVVYAVGCFTYVYVLYLLVPKLSGFLYAYTALEILFAAAYPIAVVSIILVYVALLIRLR